MNQERINKWKEEFKTASDIPFTSNLFYEGAEIMECLYNDKCRLEAEVEELNKKLIGLKLQVGNWACPVCGATNDNTIQACWECGYEYEPQ